MVAGPTALVLTYAKRFEAALEYSRRQPLHSESFLLNFLVEREIEFIEIPFRFQRVRPGGRLQLRDSDVVPPERQCSLLQQYHLRIYPNWKIDRTVYCSPNKRAIEISDTYDRASMRLTPCAENNLNLNQSNIALD